MNLWNWLVKAKQVTTYSELDPEVIATDYDVDVEDVRTVIEFISTNTRKRVEVFKFLLDELTNV